MTGSLFAFDRGSTLEIMFNSEAKFVWSAFKLCKYESGLLQIDAVESAHKSEDF